MIRRRQNYRGDFVLIEKFYRDNNGTKEQIAVPNHISIDYYTQSHKGKFTVERHGSICKNCSVSDDEMSLIVYLALSKHNIGTGSLYHCIIEYVEAPEFPDGIRANPTPGTTNIMLWAGASDDGIETISESVLQTMMYGYSAYELAKKAGYTGTVEEYSNLMKEMPEVINASQVVMEFATKWKNGELKFGGVEKDSIGEEEIKDRSITRKKIAAQAIGFDEIDNESIAEKHIRDKQITRDKIADKAVGNEQIANTAVTEEKLAANAVTGEKVKQESLTRRTIARGAIGSEQLEDECINDKKLGKECLRPEHIGKNIIPQGKLVPSAKPAWAIDTTLLLTTRSLTLSSVVNEYANSEAIPTYTISTNTTVNAMGAIADEAARPMFILKMQSSTTGERIITVRDYFGEMTLALGTGQCVFITFVKAIVPNGQTFGETVTQEQYVVSSTLIR